MDLVVHQRFHIGGISMALKTKKIILSILLIMLALGLIGLYSYYNF